MTTSALYKMCLLNSIVLIEKRKCVIRAFHHQWDAFFNA